MAEQSGGAPIEFPKIWLAPRLPLAKLQRWPDRLWSSAGEAKCSRSDVAIAGAVCLARWCRFLLCQ